MVDLLKGGVSKPSSDVGVPDDAALPEAAKLIQAAAGVEETRFNNLNSRAIALLSATSLVTTLAGLFGKDILGDDLGEARSVVAGCLALTLVLLVLVATGLVWKVLVPGRRLTFGDNPLTNEPGTLNTPESVNAVAFNDYLQIHTVLLERNRDKAAALHTCYWLFLLAVAVIAVGAFSVAAGSLF